MNIRVFTLRFNPAIERFDDSELQDFIKDKEVISMNDHFFLRDNMPYLTLVVGFHLPGIESDFLLSEKKGTGRDASWRDLLQEEDMPLFNTLRTWRNETSKQEGIPPYVICTNRQLAQIVVAKPQSIHALGEIKGVGEGKLKKYGGHILALMPKVDGGAERKDNETGKATEQGSS